MRNEGKNKREGADRKSPAEEGEGEWAAHGAPSNKIVVRPTLTTQETI